MAVSKKVLMRLELQRSFRQASCRSMWIRCHRSEVGTALGREPVRGLQLHRFLDHGPPPRRRHPNCWSRWDAATWCCLLENQSSVGTHIPDDQFLTVQIANTYPNATLHTLGRSWHKSTRGHDPKSTWWNRGLDLEVANIATAALNSSIDCCATSDLQMVKEIRAAGLALATGAITGIKSSWTTALIRLPRR